MRGNLSTSLLEGFTCSDAAQSDCENRTVVWKLLEKRHAGSWLSRFPLTKNWKIAGTFSQEHCSVFVGRWLQCSPAAPCWIGKSSSWLKKRVSRNETAKPSLRSFTSFQMIHTHTLVCVVDHTLFLVSDPPNLVDWPSIHLDNVGLLIRYLLVYDCITCWIYGRYCLLQLDGFIDKPTNIAVDPWGNAETISIYR